MQNYMKVELRVYRDNYITRPGNLGNNAHYVQNKTNLVPFL